MMRRFLVYSQDALAMGWIRNNVNRCRGVYIYASMLNRNPRADWDFSLVHPNGLINTVNVDANGFIRYTHTREDGIKPIVIEGLGGYGPHKLFSVCLGGDAKILPEIRGTMLVLQALKINGVNYDVGDSIHMDAETEYNVEQ